MSQNPSFMQSIEQYKRDTVDTTRQKVQETQDRCQEHYRGLLNEGKTLRERCQSDMRYCLSRPLPGPVPVLPPPVRPLQTPAMCLLGVTALLPQMGHTRN